MPKCYICSCVFISVGALVFHFRHKHNLDANSTYRCREGKCLRDFPNLKCFRNHLIKKHTAADVCLSNTDSPQILRSVENLINENDTENITSTATVSITDIEKFKNKLSQETLSFIAKLYDLPLLPRTYVQLFIDIVANFIASGFVNILKCLVVPNLVPNSPTEISELFDVLENPFKGLKTEYLRFKNFEKSENLIPPKQYTIGRQMSAKQDKESGSVIYKNIEMVAHFMPLREVFKKLLMCGNIFDEICQYTRTLNLHNSNTGTISNFLQSSHWQNIKISLVEGDDTMTFPLFVYYDDFETGNPLGSHSGIHKLGAVYVSTPCFPPEYSSKLQNIILALLFHSDDRKAFGNNNVFRILVDELQFLEQTGIVITHRGKEMRIKFVLVLILGDNLGLHTLLGFVENFSATHPCRFCNISKNDLHVQCSDNVQLHRTKDNYNNSILFINPSATGVKQNCIFNELKYFHVTNNMYVDPMHDLAEGICHYDIILILKYYIHTTKLFTLDTLNHKIASFNYGPEKSNKPPSVNSDFCNKLKLSMSASEMLCFIRCFSLFIGHLVPHGCEVWNLYLHLRCIIDIVYARHINENMIKILEHHIKEHHMIYLNISKDTLKPKFHHLIHYPFVMRNIGPLCNITCIRYEAKHRESKLTANVTCCRINVTKTLSQKHQLKLCYRLLSNTGFHTDLSLGPEVDNIIDYDSLPAEFQGAFITRWVNVNGTVYSSQEYSAIIVNSLELMPQFGLIKNIFVTESNKIGFLYYVMQTLEFDEHYHAYVVKKPGVINFIEYSAMLDSHLGLVTSLICNKMLVTLKYQL